MSCFHPLYGYKSSSGKWLSKTNDINAEPMTVPCGQCTGCRSEYSRQWALRNMHEASLTPNNNCFITLTYDKKNLPQNNSLDKKAFPKFIRSLRQKNKGTKIRYYACGEYGDNFGRPHYHAILFNYFPSDIKPLKKDLYTSKSISEAWLNKGHASVGMVTFQSAAYVSNYVQKKINGKNKLEHYTNTETGEWREPEFSLMSRKPGIGKQWYDKYYKDIYQIGNDGLHMNGKFMKPPKYYDTQYKQDYPELMEILKNNRIEKFEEIAHLFTPESLVAAEHTHKARMSLYKRKLK
jgi:hypothetical protein